MMALLKRLFYEEDGQSMVEYGLIIALVAVVVIVALTTMGGRLSALFGKVNAELPEE
ncbi:MAG: pilus assembly protein Flp/PilA [Bacillota bacterium]|nr:Flp family type IVb pilin [Bacillota bacterium]MDK2931774.1 pilus assembly protein Flp/PilA [Bacillota bacterium]